MTFDLNELYRKAFGPIAPPYPIGGIPDPENAFPINPKNINEKHKAVFGGEHKAMLNTYIRLPFKILIPGKNKEKEYYSFPNEPIVSISGGGNLIKETNLNGRTVKEIYGSEDYKINIRGIIINEEEDEYPDTIVRNIRTLLEHPGTLEVSSFICSLFGIHEVAVADFRFSRDFETQLRWCWYEINLIQDEPFYYEHAENGPKLSYY